MILSERIAEVRQALTDAKGRGPLSDTEMILRLHVAALVAAAEESSALRDELRHATYRLCVEHCPANPGALKIHHTDACVRRARTLGVE